MLVNKKDVSIFYLNTFGLQKLSLLTLGMGEIIPDPDLFFRCVHILLQFCIVEPYTYFKLIYVTEKSA
jgi:hypothetical protein